MQIYFSLGKHTKKSIGFLGTQDNSHLVSWHIIHPAVNIQNQNLILKLAYKEFFFDYLITFIDIIVFLKKEKMVARLDSQTIRPY